MIKILDDCISAGVQNQLEEIISSKEFKWNFKEDIIKKNTTDSNPGFTHVVQKLNSKTDYYYDLLIAVLHFASQKAGFEAKFINNNIRIFMLTNYSNFKIHDPHVDLDIPHIVMLYYVKDSDGPTYFYDKNKEVIKTVEPKKGRCVFFRGDILHGSSTPIENYSRIVINYNFNMGIPYNTYHWNNK